LFDRSLYRRAILAKEPGPTRGFFEISGFGADDQHRDGRLSLIDARHRENAGAHFGGHAETGEISRAKGVFCEPAIGDRDDAMILVGFGNFKSREEGAGEPGQEEEFYF